MRARRARIRADEDESDGVRGEYRVQEGEESRERARIPRFVEAENKIGARESRSREEREGEREKSSCEM